MAARVGGTRRALDAAIDRYLDGPPSPRRELELAQALTVTFIAGVAIAVLGRRWRLQVPRGRGGVPPAV